MLERDEYGYVLKIVSNFPYHPWWRLTSQLVEGFRDKKKTGLVSSVGVYSPKFGLGSFENPKMIGSGHVGRGDHQPSGYGENGDGRQRAVQRARRRAQGNRPFS